MDSLKALGLETLPIVAALFGFINKKPNVIMLEMNIK